MTIFQAIILGTIQGIFMFFPVSSTSHLVIAQHWMIQRGAAFPSPESPEMLLFDLVVHVGTLVSIAVVFRRELAAFLRGVFTQLAELRHLGLGVQAVRKAPDFLFLKLSLLGVVSVFVTGVVGLPLKRIFEQVFATPLAIGVTLTITGIILWQTDRVFHSRCGLRGMNVWRAVVIGLGQCLALMPGLSRSGMTIAFGLFVGLQRRWAAEYSFFLAIPTILAATLLQAISVFRAGSLVGVSWEAYAVAFVVSALVGIVALRIVLRLLYRAKFRYFSYYVWILAAVIFVGLATGTFRGA